MIIVHTIRYRLAFALRSDSTLLPRFHVALPSYLHSSLPSPRSLKPSSQPSEFSSSAAITSSPRSSLYRNPSSHGIAAFSRDRLVLREDAPQLPAAGAACASLFREV